MFAKNSFSRVSHEFHFTPRSFISAMCIAMILSLGVSAVCAQEVEPSNLELSEIAFSKDTSIRDALTVLSERFNVNIVPSTVVTGQIGFTKLRDVTFEQAMEDVLGSEFMYEQVGPTIRVYSQAEYDAMRLDVRRMVHKVFTLYYISAEEAQRMIEPILSTGGVIQSSSPAEREGATVDSSIAAVTGGDTMADNDRLIVRDYPEAIADVEILLSELDVRPKQVLVEATIMSARLTEDTEFGIDWENLGDVAVNAVQSGFARPGTGMNVGISSDHFEAFIRALEEITDTTLLANPKILAVNKQLGQVYIGKKIGYRDSSGVGLSGEVVEGEVKFLETGTKLSFRPYIGNDGYVRMDIFPKDSTGNLNSEGVPDETSTELATNIIIKDGQTVVIGGLFRDQITRTRNQVPLLGNLPILGGLFRGHKDTTTREEMVILLTVHIIGASDQIDDPEAVDEVARKHQAAKDAMQPLSRIKQAEQLYERACQDYVEGDLGEAMRQVVGALQIRPNYPEAVRLKEDILVQTDIKAFEELPRNITAEAEAMVAQDQD
jgi:type IV pilus assembly protein PilQ